MHLEKRKLISDRVVVWGIGAMEIAKLAGYISCDASYIYTWKIWRCGGHGGIKGLKGVFGLQGMLGHTAHRRAVALGLQGCFKGYYMSLIGAKARERVEYIRRLNNINSQVIHQTAGEHEWDEPTAEGLGGNGGCWVSTALNQPPDSPNAPTASNLTPHPHIIHEPAVLPSSRGIIPLIYRGVPGSQTAEAPGHGPGLISDKFSLDLTSRPACLCIQLYWKHNFQPGN